MWGAVSRCNPRWNAPERGSCCCLPTPPPTGKQSQESGYVKVQCRVLIRLYFWRSLSEERAEAVSGLENGFGMTRRNSTAASRTGPASINFLLLLLCLFICSFFVCFSKTSLMSEQVSMHLFSILLNKCLHKAAAADSQRSRQSPHSPQLSACCTASSLSK